MAQRPNRKDGILVAGFLVLLLVAWIAVFFPAVSRARERSPLASSEDFKRSLALIGPQSVDHPLGVRATGAAADRQLTIKTGRVALMIALLVTVTGTALLVVVGRASVEVHLAADALLAFYVAWLIEDRRRHEERTRKISSLSAYRRATTAVAGDELQVAGEPL